MTIERIRDYPHPGTLDSIESIADYIHRLWVTLGEESTERIADFEGMEIDVLTVNDWTIGTSFKPSSDASVDLGLTGYRFQDLHLSGDITDGTNSLTVANAKTAYTHVSSTGVNHGYINQDVQSSASPSFAGASLTGELDITKASTLLIDLNPGFTGTGEVISIVPSAALAAEDSEWDGIKIDGTALDPGAGIIGCNIHGIHIDMSGVLMTREPNVDGLRIDMPATSHIERVHALHANHGIYLEADITTLSASTHSTTIDVVYDDVGSTGGDVHALDVASIDGGSATMVAVATHTGIDVIHQHIGTATAFDKVWEYDDSGSSWVDVTTACGSAGTDVALWDAQDDVVYFGHSTTFDEIICTWATPATKSMHFTFWYSTGTSTYTQFYPADDTDGGQISGVIRFLASDIGSWAVGTVNGTTTKYWIKVIRTRLVGTAPTEDTVKFIKGTTYEWNKTGAITAASASLGTGELTTGSINRASGTMTLEIGGSVVQSIQSGVVSLGYSDTARLSLLNASSAERAFLLLDSTRLKIDADSDIYFQPANSESIRFLAAGGLGLGVSVLGTNATKVFGMGNATAPTTSPADMVQTWSEDIMAGHAQLHYRAEGGIARPLDKQYDVRDYGASNSTSAPNNRIAIQAAIDAAPIGGTVIIPRMSAVYALDTTTPLVLDGTKATTLIIEGEINFTDGNNPNTHDFCDVTGNDITIIGAGGKIKGDGNFDQSGAIASAVFHVTGDRFTCRDLTIEDPVQCGIYLIGTANSVISGIRIVGGPASYSAPQHYGIEMEGAGTYGILISNVAIIPNGTGGNVCQGIASGASCGGFITVTGCYIEGTHDNGTYLVASNCTVTGNTFKDSVSGLKVVGKYSTVTGNTLNGASINMPNCESSTITGNRITDYESVGIDIYNTGGYAGTFNDIIVANNLLIGKANLSLTGIRMRTEANSGRNIQIVNNVLRDVDNKGDQYEGISVYADDGTILERVKIDSNTVDTIGDNGIHVKNVSQGSISNNLIRDPCQQTANKYGIYVESGCDDLYIADNRIAKETAGAGAMPYGIVIVASASNTNCIVENNKITGDGTGEVSAGRSEGHQLWLTDSNMDTWLPRHLYIGWSDTAHFGLLNSVGTERAYLEIAGTGLRIDADSDIDICPNNTLAATFTASGAVTLVSTLTAATGSTIGNLTFANGSITDSGGTIAFGDEDLSTTGKITSLQSFTASSSRVILHADSQVTTGYLDFNLLNNAIVIPENTGYFRIGEATSNDELMRVTATGNVFIGDTTNAKMTQGLTINQGANDDEILAFKSSDVAHGITDFAETDTFGSFGKAVAATGGLTFTGLGSAAAGFILRAMVTDDNTSKNTSAHAPIEIIAYKKNGTTVAAMGADGNLLVIRNGGGTSARFIFDEDGDMFYDGAAPANYQDHDDVKLVQELEDICIKKIKPNKRKDKEVVSLGIINEAGFVSTKKKNMLLYGSIRQLNTKIEALEEEIEELKK